MKNLTFLLLIASLFFGGNEEVRTITGIVYYDDGEPAIAANIVVDGDEGIGTVSEFDGTFSLDVPESAKALNITYIGYNEQIVSITDTNYVEVILEENQLLSEVVVVKAIRTVRNLHAYEISSALASAAPSASSSVPLKNKSKEKEDKTTWKRSGKIANTATLFIGDEEQLPIQGTQIAVTVDGFRARVLVDCFFYNDEEFQREGTFKMRLPQGAVPYYFAFGESVYKNENKDLDSIPFVDYEQIDFSPEGIENMRSSTWTNPREARIVEKEKAAFAYGSEVRQKVDPALAEWAGADVYNCRVFPLLPKQLHRIVIGYDMNLNQLDDDWLLNFGIPEVDCPKILDFEIVEFPNIRSEIKPAQKVKIENNYKKFRLTNPEEKEIAIRYQELGNMTLLSNKKDNKKYFATAVTPTLAKSAKNALHKKGIIALDISLSSNPDKFNIWLKLVEEILTNNKDVIQEFNVLLFNVESFWWKNNTVKNNSTNINDFLEFANTLSLEGASDLGLAFSEISKKEKETNIFLLSDGAATWGFSDDYELSNLLTTKQTVFSYNTGLSGTSTNTLQHLARESGGAVFSIISEDEITNASKAFRTSPWRIESLKVKNGTDILIAGRPQYIYADQKLMIAGRYNNKLSANIELIVSQNGKKKKLKLPISNLIPSELTARIFGQIATEQLETFGHATEKYSISYAKHFKVPGQTCSMLMLETEEDYKEYDINATEDSFVVNSMLANQLIQDVINTIGETLGDAKIKFQNWLEKLTQMPGTRFEKNASIDLICKQLSASDFSLNPKGLNCLSKTKENVVDSIREELSKEKLDYTSISNAAEKRKEKYSTHDALKLLSSLIEKNSGDGVLARDVAYSALEWNLNEQAYFLLKRVLDARPYEPPTYHAIAQALAKVNKKELALLYYEIAVSTKWDEKFGEFKKVVGLDYIRFLNKVKNDNSFKLKEFAREKIKTLESLYEEKEADILVTITWNTDNTDVDLQISEPTGDVCYYSNPKTDIGGRLTEDVVEGYGPEMYILKKAPKGKYMVTIDYYSEDESRTSTRTKVYITLYKYWGKENEEITKKVVMLNEEEEEEVDVMEFEF